METKGIEQATEDDLDAVFKRKAAKLASKWRSKSKGNEVGCSEKKPILVHDKVFILSIEAFWEKQSYYECTVEGVGFEYYKVLQHNNFHCIDF